MSARLAAKAAVNVVAKVAASVVSVASAAKLMLLPAMSTPPTCPWQKVKTHLQQKVAHLQRTKANAVSAAHVTAMAATAVNAMAKIVKIQLVMTRKLLPVPARMPHLHRLLPLKPLVMIAPHNAPILSVRNKLQPLDRPRQSPPKLRALRRPLSHLLRRLSPQLYRRWHRLLHQSLRQPLWWLYQLQPLPPKHPLLLAPVCPWSPVTPCKLTT